jgi:hypothetical protein
LIGSPTPICPLWVIPPCRQCRAIMTGGDKMDAENGFQRDRVNVASIFGRWTSNLAKHVETTSCQREKIWSIDVNRDKSFTPAPGQYCQYPPTKGVLILTGPQSAASSNLREILPMGGGGPHLGPMEPNENLQPEILRISLAQRPLNNHKRGPPKGIRQHTPGNRIDPRVQWGLPLEKKLKCSG